MSNLKEIKKLRAQLRKIKDTICHYRKLFEEDGVIDAKEQEDLDALEAMANKVEATIDDKEDDLSFWEGVRNRTAAMTESVKDTFSKKDDIVDHSLVNTEDKVETLQKLNTYLFSELAENVV